MGTYTFPDTAEFQNKIAQVVGLRKSAVSLQVEIESGYNVYILTIPDEFDAAFGAADGSIDTVYIEPHTISKLTMVNRLIEASLFTAAMAALGEPGDPSYERWSAASVVHSDNVEIRTLLTAIEADLDVILAPEVAV